MLIILLVINLFGPIGDEPAIAWSFSLCLINDKNLKKDILYIIYTKITARFELMSVNSIILQSIYNKYQ